MLGIDLVKSFRSHFLSYSSHSQRNLPSTAIMPKSKRAKVVHTSKTKKKGKELSLRLYANIQECIPQYPYLYIFTVHNMRNQSLKEVRTKLADSRYVRSGTLSPFRNLRIPQ